MVATFCGATIGEASLAGTGSWIYYTAQYIYLHIQGYDQQADLATKSLLPSPRTVSLKKQIQVDLCRLIEADPGVGPRYRLTSSYSMAARAAVSTEKDFYADSSTSEFPQR
jgi:hypothetical protein